MYHVEVDQHDRLLEFLSSFRQDSVVSVHVKVGHLADYPDEYVYHVPSYVNLKIINNKSFHAHHLTAHNKSKEQPDLK